MKLSSDTFKLVLTTLMACAAGALPGADRTWLPKAGGSYLWEDSANWQGGTLPGTSDTAQMRVTGMTGNQHIRVEEPKTLNDFYPGCSDVPYQYEQTFSGAPITVNTNFRVMGGHVALENTLSKSSGEAFIGLVGKADLTLRGSGSLLFTNVTFTVGNKEERFNAGAGALYVTDSASLEFAGSGALNVARRVNGTPNNPGKIWQEGGKVTVRNNFLLGNSSDAYYRLTGGVLDIPYRNNYIRTIRGLSYSLMHIDGGRLERTGTVEDYRLLVGHCDVSAATASRHAEVYLSGNGVLYTPSVAFIVNAYTGSATLPHTATMTIDEDALFYGRNIGMGDNTAPANTKAILNLNGGLCSLNYYLSRFDGGQNETHLNFNGGTLQWRAGITITSPLSSISNIVIYPKGGVLDTSGNTIGTETPRSASFRSAKGWGVSEIELTSPGAEYGAAPRVAITGGSGSNATAVAVMTRDGRVERVAVTCPGEGYAETDQVSVTFITDSGYGFGGGAAATATLSENTPGTLVKKGINGTWRLTGTNTFDSAIKIAEGYLNFDEHASLPELATLALAGGYFTAQTSLDNAVNPAATLELTGGRELSTYRQQRPADAQESVSQSYAALHAHHGSSVIKSIGTGEGAAGLYFNDYQREGALVGFTPTENDRLWLAANANISPQAAAPVVSGFVSEDGKNLLERNSLNGYLELAATSATPAADANFLVSATFATNSATGVNAIIFPDRSGDAQFWFGTSGEAKVHSGMIISRRSIGAVQRVGTLPGGTLTTDQPAGMVIFDPGTTGRSLEDMDASGTRRLLVSASLADPAGGEPMAVTVAGLHRSAPAMGALVRFMTANTFSGGLYLSDCGLWYDGDALLGASGCPVIAGGYSALIPAGNVLATAADRPLVIAEGAALQLLSRRDHGATIAGSLAGSGDLLTGPQTLRTYTVFGGDHSAFTGSYYVLGNLRAGEDGEDLSRHAAICFADSSSGFGTLDISGEFTRPLTTKAGGVCWKKHHATGGLCGGFSAWGGDLTVNLHGDGRTLEFGSDALPANALLYLQNRQASGRLTLVNGLDLMGHATPHIRVSTDLVKEAYLSGVIRDSVGGGTLTKGGQGVLVLEQSPTMNGILSITSGSIRLAEGVSLDSVSEVSITGDGRSLEVAGNEAEQRIPCAVTGTGGLVVSGGNTVVMSGASTYSGTTAIAANSTLAVEGSHLGGDTYSVAGTLSGSGTIAPKTGATIIFAAGSRISPGGAGTIGTLTLGDSETDTTVTMNSATIEIDLDSSSADKLEINGDLELSGNNSVTILTTDEGLLKSLRNTAIVIAQWSGEKVGSIAVATNLSGWRVFEDSVAKTLKLVCVPHGTLISIK